MKILKQYSTMYNKIKNYLNMNICLSFSFAPWTVKDIYRNDHKFLDRQV